MSVLEAFHQMLAQRMDHINEHILNNIEDYQRLNDECDGIFAVIIALLEEGTITEIGKLLIEYEDKKLEVQALVETVMYEQGVKDGCELKKILS